MTITKCVEKTIPRAEREKMDNWMSKELNEILDAFDKNHSSSKLLKALRAIEDIRDVMVLAERRQEDGINDYFIDDYTRCRFSARRKARAQEK